jgi:hypothetical protein
VSSKKEKERRKKKRGKEEKESKREKGVLPFCIEDQVVDSYQF